MAKAFKINSQLSPEFINTGVIVAAGGASTIAVGTPAKSADAYNANTGAAVPMVDGDGTTAQSFFGIAASTSTDTASAAGSVSLYTPVAGIQYSGFAKSTAAVDTAAELAVLFHKAVFFDLTSTDWTVDTGATVDSKVNCVIIVGGNISTGEVYFMYSPKGTYLNYCVSA